MTPVVGALRVWYGLLSHAAGPERKLILHAVDKDLAEKMAWSSLVGSKQYWDLVLVEAVDYQATVVS
jgi:hypothetical protein